MVLFQQKLLALIETVLSCNLVHVYDDSMGGGGGGVLLYNYVLWCELLKLYLTKCD